jgi:hypothetical protein
VRGSVTVDGLVIPKDVEHLDGFRAWKRTLGDDAPRVHFSQSRIWVQMSPQDYFSHLRVVGQVNARLTQLAQELDVGQYWSDGGWITNRHVGLSTEPDGFLVLWETLERGDARYVPAASGRGAIELIGRGDMVLEVVSDYSEAKDTVQLAADYAAAGFREYWLIDARRSIPSFRVLLLQPDRTYKDTEPDADGYLASPVWGRRFRVEAGTDRAGHPTYRLLVE